MEKESKSNSLNNLEKKYSPKVTETLNSFKKEAEKINEQAKKISEALTEENTITMEHLLNETIKFMKGEITMEDLEELAKNISIKIYKDSRRKPIAFRRWDECELNCKRVCNEHVVTEQFFSPI